MSIGRVRTFKEQAMPKQPEHKNTAKLTPSSLDPGATTPALRKPRVAVKVRAPFVLETPRLRIRPMQASDREDFVRMLRESRSMLDQFLPLQTPGELDDAVFDRHLELTRASLACPDVAIRRVIERDGHVIGLINLNDIQPGFQRSAEVVAWITSSAVGQGLGSEAIDAVAVDALAPSPLGLGLSILYVLVSPVNTAALRAFQHAGFAEAPAVPLVELPIQDSWRPHMVLIRTSVVGKTKSTPDAGKIVVRRLLASAASTP